VQGTTKYRAKTFISIKEIYNIHRNADTRIKTGDKPAAGELRAALRCRREDRDVGRIAAAHLTGRVELTWRSRSASSGSHCLRASKPLAFRKEPAVRLGQKR